MRGTPQGAEVGPWGPARRRGPDGSFLAFFRQRPPMGTVQKRDTLSGAVAADGKGERGIGGGHASRCGCPSAIAGNDAPKSFPGITREPAEMSGNWLSNTANNATGCNSCCGLLASEMPRKQGFSKRNRENGTAKKRRSQCRGRGFESLRLHFAGCVSGEIVQVCLDNHPDGGTVALLDRFWGLDGCGQASEQCLNGMWISRLPNDYPPPCPPFHERDRSVAGRRPDAYDSSRRRPRRVGGDS